MGYNYIDLTKRKDEIPNHHCWLTVTREIPRPTPKDGKKKCSKEQIDDYNKITKKHMDTITALEDGHVLLNNRGVKPDDLHSVVSYNIFGNNNSRIFKISPIQVIKNQESYSSNVTYSVQEFDVVTEISSLDEFIKQVVNDGDTFRLLWQTFEYGTYGNEGYRDKCLYIFQKCKEVYGRIPSLTDLIYKKYNHYEHYARFDVGNKRAKELIDELVVSSLVKFTGEYESKYEPLDALLQMRWTDIALKVVQSFDGDDVNWIIKRNNGEIKKTLSLLNDDNDVQEIIKILNIQSDFITLKVEEDYDDGYCTRTIETKDFEKMSDLRTYLVKQYNVPFDKASGNINEIYINDDDNLDFYGYHFSIVGKTE